MLIPLGFNRHNRHRFDDAEISPWKGLPGPRGSGPCEHRRVPPRRAGAAARRDAVVFGEADARAARQPGRSDLQVRGREERTADSGELPRVRAFSRCRQRADVDRRSRSADSDDAVEAGADDRIHEDDVRARLSVSGHDDGVDGPLFDRIGFALAARRQESRPAFLRRRTARAAAAHRGHLRDVQGGLASGGNAARQRRRRMAVVEERGDAVGAGIRRRTSRCTCTSIIRDSLRRRSR